LRGSRRRKTAVLLWAGVRLIVCGQRQTQQLLERYGEEWTSSSWKETLRAKIDEAKGQCTSREEFEKYLLENYGVEMPRNTARTVSFKHPAVDETVRGVKLGAEYTAESIDRALIENQVLCSGGGRGGNARKDVRHGKQECSGFRRIMEWRQRGS